MLILCRSLNHCKVQMMHVESADNCIYSASAIDCRRVTPYENENALDVLRRHPPLTSRASRSPSLLFCKPLLTTRAARSWFAYNPCIYSIIISIAISAHSLASLFFVFVCFWPFLNDLNCVWSRCGLF